jgi:hypothetical protein
MKNRNRILIALTLSLTLPFTLSLADETPEKEESAVPEVLHFESGHSVKVGDKTIKFTATAGTLEMKNTEGDPIAHFGYTAYVQKDVDKGTRPILFAYNGGPGSASLWLHMGILGPQRTVVEDTAFTSTGPFKRVNNIYSILDQADVFSTIQKSPVLADCFHDACAFLTGLQWLIKLKPVSFVGPTLSEQLTASYFQAGSGAELRKRNEKLVDGLRRFILDDDVGSSVNF